MCCGTHVTNLSQVQVNGCPSYFVVCKAVKTSLCSSTRRETKKSWDKIVKFCLSQNVGILVLEAYSFVYLVSVTDLYSMTSGHGKLDVCNHVTLSFLFVHFEINLSLCGLY